MYSYEDRIRAVERYIKLGKRVKATMRQLGYPTKPTFQIWVLKQETRLAAGSLLQSVRRP